MFLERTLLLLIIIGFLGTIYRFETVNHQKGQMGPASKLLDWTIFTDTKDNSSVRTITASSTTYEFDRSSNIRRLNEKYQNIEKQRSKLVADRKDILDKLMVVHDKLAQHVAEYAEKRGSDPTGLQGAWARLKGDKAAQLSSLTQSLGGEYKYLKDNPYVDSDELEHSQQYIQTVSKELVKEILEVSDQGINDLMVLYSDLEREQDFLLANLKLDYENFQQMAETKQSLMDERTVKDRQLSNEDELQKIRDKQRDLRRSYYF